MPYELEAFVRSSQAHRPVRHGSSSATGENNYGGAVKVQRHRATAGAIELGSGAGVRDHGLKREGDDRHGSMIPHEVLRFPGGIGATPTAR